MDKQDHFLHSNLIEMLKTFSKDEVKEFDKFARSPFHNNRNEATRYWSELKKFHPSFIHGDFTKEKIYEKLYPEEKYRDDVMRRSAANLKSLIENYLSYKHFLKNAFETKLRLAESLFERNLDKLLEKQFKLCEETLGANGGLSWDYFHNKYRLCEQKHNFYITRKKTGAVISNYALMFDSLIYDCLCGSFTMQYNHSTMESMWKMKSSSGIQSWYLNSFDSDKLADEIKRNPDNENLLVLAYYYLNLACQNPEDEKVQLKLVELLREHSGKFDRYTNFCFYTGLLTIYTLNTRNGNTGYRRKELELYKDVISKDLLISTESGYVDLYDFMNIINHATVLKEFQWAEWFVDKYIDRANPAERTDILNYSKASISYYRKEYDKALEFIMKVNFDFFKYSAKLLLCKIYFDMGYTEQLFSLIDSFRHYLNNDKRVPKDVQANNLSFLIYLNKLLKIKCNNDYKALPILKKNILKGPHLGKDWLLEKIEELENIKK